MRLQWAEHVARMGETKNAHRILLRNLLEKSAWETEKEI
jgi:hypothetical protein